MQSSNKMYGLTMQIFDAMNSRDFSMFEKVIKEELVFDFPGAGRIEGHRRVIPFLKALLRKYPRLTFSVSEVISGKDRACAVWTNEGEDSKGNTYENSGITLIHFKDGMITFISDYFKDTSFSDSQ